jgi:hypothetical protein
VVVKQVRRLEGGGCVGFIILVSKEAVGVVDESRDKGVAWFIQISVKAFGGI